ncbi:8830_t:CDS:2, partial [Paraglomus brasilianum]
MPDPNSIYDALYKRSWCIQNLRPQSRQDQLSTSVFTFGGLQLTNEQQTPGYNIDGSNLAVREQLVTGSIQQQNDSLITHRQPRQQQWLSQHPHSRQ